MLVAKFSSGGPMSLASDKDERVGRVVGRSAIVLSV